ncbi:hypothetical protein ACLOJK_006629 [Asimina triloba]
MLGRWSYCHRRRIAKIRTRCCKFRQLTRRLLRLDDKEEDDIVRLESMTEWVCRSLLPSSSISLDFFSCPNELDVAVIISGRQGGDGDDTDTRGVDRISKSQFSPSIWLHARSGMG